MKRQSLVKKIRLSRGRPVPKKKSVNLRYREIADDLLRDIESGKLAVGNMLHPEEELSRIFKVSRGTLRQSLGLLEELGVILRRKRTGTTVLARFPGRGVVSGEQLLEDWARYGIDYPLKVISTIYQHPPVDLVQEERPSKAKWLHIVGLRYPVGSRVPTAYSQVYISPKYREIEKDISSAPVPMFAHIERRYGRVIETVQMNVSACELSPEMASALGARPGQSALEIRRLFLDARRNVVSIGINTHPSERYAYSIEIPRQPAGKAIDLG